MTQTVLLGDLMLDPSRNGLTKPKRVRGSGTKMVNMGELFANPRILNVDMDRVPLEQKERNSLLKPFDLLFARQSLVLEGAGKCSIFLSDTEDVCFESHIIRVRIDPKLADPRYIFYWLLSPKGKHAISSKVEQGAGAAGIRGSDLQKVKIDIPELPEQTRVADILENIDEKIELNRNMNETLEQMGQAIFRHYFIDNPAAKMWKEMSLDDIADFLNGLAMQKYPVIEGEPTLPVIKIREMSSGITTNSGLANANIPPQYIVHNGDLLFSWSGTLLVKFWSEGAGALNQHLFKVTSIKYPEWLYYYWTQYHLDDFIQTAKSKATTMGHIQRGHLRAAKVRVPDETTMRRIGEQIQPLIDECKINSEEIQTLTTLRDTLLPRLISGKIKV